MLPDARNIILQNLPARFQKVSVPVETRYGDESSIEDINNTVVNRQVATVFSLNISVIMIALLKSYLGKLL